MKNNSKGFTLLEVILAVALFSIVAVVVLASNRGSMNSVKESEEVFNAVQIAELKMAELELKKQKQIDADGVESSFGDECGTFEEPHAQYTWCSVLRETEMEFSVDLLSSFLKEFGVEEEAAKEQANNSGLIITNLNKNVKKLYAELELTIKWKSLVKENSLVLVTHLIPTKPKIEISTTVENP